MRALAITTFLSFSLTIFAAPVSDTEAFIQDLTSASARYRRDAIPVTHNEPIAVSVGGLVERARGSRAGGEESAADPRKFKSTGGGRREAEPIKRSMKNPGGGIRDDSESIKLGSPSGNRREAAPETVNGLEVAAGGGRRDAAPQPGRLDIGKGHDVRPGGGTRISRGLRGNGANPRGVRPGNGNNQRDITAETVEARGRFRGISSRV